MTGTLITPWLVAIVGIFSTGFVIAYPSLDQYWQRYHYRVPEHYELKDSGNQGIPLKGPSTNDYPIIRKKLCEKLPPSPNALDHDVSGEIIFPRQEHGYTEDVVVPAFLTLKKNDSADQMLIDYIAKAENDWIKRNFRKIINGEIFTHNNKNDTFNIYGSKGRFENNPQKRSSSSLGESSGAFSKERGEGKGEQTVPAMSLQELLKYWGIDTSDEKPTMRSQRGDIEVTELRSKGSSWTRGDVPAALIRRDSLTRSQRRKREAIGTGRKLLWSPNPQPTANTWGFAEDDGMSDRTSHESDESDRYNELQHVKGNHRSHNFPVNDRRFFNNNNNNNNDDDNDDDNNNNSGPRQLQERQRSEEERRKQWEELERRRDEARRRRIEDEQRRKDEEQRRRDEEQRKIEEDQRERNDDQQRIEDQSNDEEERRRDEEQRARDEERRRVMEQRNEEERRRKEDEQRKTDEEQQRKDEARRRIIEQRNEQQKQELERSRKLEEQRRNDQEQRERNNLEERKNNRDDRRNEGRQAHKDRVRQPQHIPEDRDRLSRERERSRNPGNNEQDPENERKLQEYIRSNTPIVVGDNARSHDNRPQSPVNLRVQPLQRKPEDSTNRPNERRPTEETPDKQREEQRRRFEEERKLRDSQRRQLQEQLRRRQEEFRRRQQEQNQVHGAPNENEATTRAKQEERKPDEPRHGDQRNNEASRAPDNDDEMARRAQHLRRLQEEQRRRFMEAQNNRRPEQRRPDNHESPNEGEGTRAREEQRRPDHQYRGQPGDEEARKAEHLRRLHEEQRRRFMEAQNRSNNGRPEQRRPDNQGVFQGIKGNPRDRRPNESQRHASPREDPSNNQPSKPAEDNTPHQNSRNRSEVQNRSQDDYQRPVAPGEEGIKGRQPHQSGYRYPQPQPSDPQGHPPINVTPWRNWRTWGENRPPWNHRTEAPTPDDSANRGGGIPDERQRQEEERRRQNEAQLTTTEASNSNSRIREPLQERPDDRRNNDAWRKGWPSGGQDVPRVNQDPRRLQEQSRHEDEGEGRFLEFKKNNNPPLSSPGRYQTEQERRAEEQRLRRLPVSATIIITKHDESLDDKNSTTGPANIISRFGDGSGDLLLRGPNEKGIEVPHFQQGPGSTMRRPPVQSPKPCIWSIVICCGQPNTNEPERLRKCFESTNCPEANWDANRCSDAKVRTSNQVIRKYYLMNQQQQRQQQ